MAYAPTSTKNLRLRGREASLQRSRIIAARPLCAWCQANGITRAGVELDHIKPLFKGGTNHDDNMQMLCVPCHRVKTELEMGWAVKGTDVDGWPTDPRHPLGPGQG